MLVLLLSVICLFAQSIGVYITEFWVVRPLGDSIPLSASWAMDIRVACLILALYVIFKRKNARTMKKVVACAVMLSYR